MNRRLAVFAIAIACAMPYRAMAADAPSAPLSANEKQFVAKISADLAKRYPTPASAEKAGYHRFTVEDTSGAISYANLAWQSSDPSVPAELWYDVKGRLLGADYTVLMATSPTPPSLFGVDPSRFHKSNAHIHYVVRNADGSFTYSKAVGVKAYADTGLDATKPTADGLVKLGRVKSPSEVAFVGLWPATWDMSVWVIPNPKGAFEDLNPNVIPTKDAQKDAG